MDKRSIGLESSGLASPGQVYWNLSVPTLVEAALRRGEACLVDRGALLANTTPRTGRSPKDKFIVEEGDSRDSIDWGATNRPMSAQQFERLLSRATAYAQGRDLFVLDAHAGADPKHRMPIRVVTEFAWHNLFARQLFRRPTRQELDGINPQFTVLALPDFRSNPAIDATNSEAVIALSFERKMVLIGGTRYAGEIKKSIFTVMNYLLPERGVFPMHCSANVGADGDVALFFGLSGTGKTTLSADPARRLIGDDEHGWSSNGVFNIEGGCYAKCIRLSQESEPQIYGALRFGSVLENVVVDPITRVPNFEDDSVTENTRAAYPLELIENAVVEGFVPSHPRTVVFLTCDAFGVLPPVSRLTTPQAMYQFLAGYTAKLAGTEAGVGKEPQVTFSACFGAPFLPRPPMVYANLLAERVRSHQSRCFLVNTGWSGGPFGVGHRIKLAYTRAMVSAALNDQIKESDCKPDPVFGVLVPRKVPGVPSEILDPRGTWKDPRAYDDKARELAARFAENFKKFSGVSQEVAGAGPNVG